MHNQNLNNLIEVIKGLLSEDLLKKEFRGKSKNPLYGHCYVATETLYHLMENNENYYPHILKVNNITHWFLKSSDGKIIDITKDQFNFPLNYDQSIKQAFLTQSPSKRSKILINRIYENSGI